MALLEVVDRVAALAGVQRVGVGEERLAAVRLDALTTSRSEDRLHETGVALLAEVQLDRDEVAFGDRRRRAPRARAACPTRLTSETFLALRSGANQTTGFSSAISASLRASRARRMRAPPRRESRRRCREPPATTVTSRRPASASPRMTSAARSTMKSATLADAAADDDELGVEDVDEADERPPEHLARIEQDLARDLVAALRRHEHALGGDRVESAARRREDLAAPERGSRPRGPSRRSRDGRGTPRDGRCRRRDTAARRARRPCGRSRRPDRGCRGTARR